MSVEAFKAAKEQVWLLHDELAAGSLITDDAVMAIVDEFERRLQTNCEAAAEGLFAAVAPICRYRPQLVSLLLRRALRPLFYLGLEQAEDVREFVQWFVQQPSTYLPLPAVDRLWLEEVFPSHLTLVDELLRELRNEEYADDEPRTAT